MENSAIDTCPWLKRNNFGKEFFVLLVLSKIKIKKIDGSLRPAGRKRPSTLVFSSFVRSRGNNSFFPELQEIASCLFLVFWSQSYLAIYIRVFSVSYRESLRLWFWIRKGPIESLVILFCQNLKKTFVSILFFTGIDSIFYAWSNFLLLLFVKIPH